MLRYIYQFGSVAVLAIALLVPALYTPWDGEISDSRENRRLATFPEAPESLRQLKRWPRQFNAFVDDHFGFRQHLLQWHNRLLLSLGASGHNRVIIGREGWLFYELFSLTDQSRGALPFSSAALSLHYDVFTRRQRYVEARGSEFVVLPLPDKQALHGDLLPEHFANLGPSRLSQFLAQMQTTPINLVNVLPTLQSAVERGEPIYLKTDSHWNCRGAWLAYERLMDVVEPMSINGVSRLKREDIFIRELSVQPAGDMAEKMLALPEMFPETNATYCRPKEKREILSRSLDGERSDRRAYRPQVQAIPWRYTRLDRPVESRALLYRDSYANALIPFLLNTFDELIVVPRGKLNFDVGPLHKYQPDLVIYQFVERALWWEPLPAIAGENASDG